MIRPRVSVARRLWFGALAVSAAAAVVTAGLFVWLTLSQRGAAHGLDAIPELRYADAPGIGANTFLHREPDPRKVTRELELLRESGVGLIRQEFQWVEIEPQAKGRFLDPHGASTWAKYDNIVDTAQRLGIEILARLDRAPAWATPGFDPQANPSIQAPPRDFDDFADFAAAVAARYRGRIRYYQIWNEPNLLGEWGGRPPDPAAYLEMLRRARKAIRSVDPDAAIVLAGLAPTIETGPDNLSDLIFLRRLYELGAKGDFDVASSMSYGLFSGPRDVRIEALRTNFPRAVLWREIMLEFGDPATPIWASEYGWMALPPSWGGEPGIWGNHSIAAQASWTVDGIRRARAEWPWMPTIIVWASRWPIDAHPRDPTPYFRLMDKDFTPRPALAALRRAFAGPPRAGAGLHQETQPAIVYEGPWPRVPSNDASLGLHRETGVAGATVRFRFEGSELALLTRRGPEMGRVRVRIDGLDALPDRLPRNAGGESILDLYAPETHNLARVPIASRLPPGPHEVELTVMAQRNPESRGGLVIVDGFLVANAAPLAPYVLLAGLWGAVLAVWLWLMAPTLRRLPARLDWSRLDGARLFALHPVEIAAGAAAALYLLLPAGDLTSVWTALRAAIALAIFGLALARPMQVATVAVASIPFVGIVGRTGFFDRPVAELLILTLAAAWVLRMLWYRRLELPRGAWRWAPLFFVLAAATAAALADFEKTALRDLRTVIVEPVLLFGVLAASARDRAGALRLLWALVLGATALAVVSLASIPAGAVVIDTGVPRLRGPFGSPNNLALMLERAAPAALGLALAARLPRRAGWTSWTAFTLLAAVIVLTFSRGAWVGTILGLAMAAVPLWLRLGRTVRVGSALALTGILAFAGLSFGVDRLASLFRSSDATAQLRLSVWDSAWRMVRDNPLFGVGPDNFLYHYRAYLRPDAWSEPNISHPHNFLLDAWLSTGLLGLLAFTLILALFWRDWIRVARRATGAIRLVVFGLAGTMLAVLAHGLVDHAYFLSELAAAFWVLVAVVYVLRRDDEGRGPAAAASDSARTAKSLNV